MVLVTVPVVVQWNAALLEVVDAGGAEASVTVGAVSGGGVTVGVVTVGVVAVGVVAVGVVTPPPLLPPLPVPPSPGCELKSCVQYQVPFDAWAAPIPIELKPGYSMLSRCSGEFSQPSTTACGDW